MKKNLFVMVLCLFAVQLFSQRTETLFSRARIIGAFGGPIVEFGQFKGETTTSSGGGGALIIDNFFIGGYGVGTIDLSAIDFDDDDFSIEMGHGGFWLGYTYKPYKLAHFFASTKLGWGGLDIKFDDTGSSVNDNIFVVTPEVGLEINVFRWFRIAGTVGYRSVTGVNEINGQTNADFSGLAGTLTFRFGGFGNWNNYNRRNRDRYDD